MSTTSPGVRLGVRDDDPRLPRLDRADLPGVYPGGRVCTLAWVGEASLSSRVWQTNGGSTYYAAGSEFGPGYLEGSNSRCCVVQPALRGKF